MSGTDREAGGVAGSGGFRAAGRGQTTMDFAVGMSLFVGVVLFVFLFVPGILDPFTVGAQDETVTSNRVADSLTQDLLNSPERPGVLAADCTAVFFEYANNADAVDVCGFDGEQLTDMVGVDRRQQVNVTVLGNVSAADTGSDLLCWDDDAEALVERDDSPGDCTQVLRAGDRPYDNTDAVTASRVAALAGEDVTVRVEMW